MGLIRRGQKKQSTRSARPAGTTIIAGGTRLAGELHLEGALHVDGTVEGTISSTGDISVGRTGYLEGTISAERLLVSGEVRGRIECETLEIVESGKVFGEVASQGFIIEPGGQFVGESMSRDEPRTAGGNPAPLAEAVEPEVEAPPAKPVPVAEPTPDPMPAEPTVPEPGLENAGAAEPAVDVAAAAAAEPAEEPVVNDEPRVEQAHPLYRSIGD